ncbi:MAG TPA: hypothetical protein VMS12_04520 [Thermoanaerobaculia bacterium]|nr:hypothetical protein [Thermoanaerobaculia bacterium]
MEQPRDLPQSDPEGEPVQQLPRWIALLIGIVLVSLAALAAYTGLRYRSAPEDRPIASRQGGDGIRQGGAPGAPQAGESRVGEAGENIPDAEPPDRGRRPRIEITGGPDGVFSTVRYTASRAAVFAVEPDTATVFVNGEQIGQASQFRGPDDVYEFAAPGKYNIRIAAPGHRDETVILTADPGSSTEVVRISRKLIAE